MGRKNSAWVKAHLALKSGELCLFLHCLQCIYLGSRQLLFLTALKYSTSGNQLHFGFWCVWVLLVCLFCFFTLPSSSCVICFSRSKMIFRLQLTSEFFCDPLVLWITFD